MPADDLIAAQSVQGETSARSLSKGSLSKFNPFYTDEKGNRTAGTLPDRLTAKAGLRCWRRRSCPKTAWGHERRPLHQTAAFDFRYNPVATEIVRRCNMSRRASSDMKGGPPLNHNSGMPALRKAVEHFAFHEPVRAPGWVSYTSQLFRLLAQAAAETRSPGPVDERLHLFQRNLAVFIAVHCTEDSLVSRLKLLQ